MYVLYACTKKEPQEPPEHTPEHVKPQNFLGACPQTPSHNLYYGPTFCICPGPLPSSWRPCHVLQYKMIDLELSWYSWQFFNILAMFRSHSGNLLQATIANCWCNCCCSKKITRVWLKHCNNNNKKKHCKKSNKKLPTTLWKSKIYQCISQYPSIERVLVWFYCWSY